MLKAAVAILTIGCSSAMQTGTGETTTAAITAKDKLRRMLGKGIAIGAGPRSGGVCFSSEQADRCTVEEHGIDGVEKMVGRAKPDMYSADRMIESQMAKVRSFRTRRQSAGLDHSVDLFNRRA